MTSTAPEHRGIEMHRGDHICALYDDAQARDVVLSFGQYSSGGFLAER